MEIKKENWYVCTESLEYRDCIYKKGGLYQSSADGYLNDENGVSNSFCWSGKHYFRPATAEEIVIGRALTEEQQFLVEELELKIKLAKIDFMKCGLPEEQALAQVDLIVKNAIREVYHPKK